MFRIFFFDLLITGKLGIEISIKYLILLVLILFFNLTLICNPKISLSFDDGSTQSYINYDNDDWDMMIRNSLKTHNLKTIFFVKGANLDNRRGKNILKYWDNDGHLIANHTYNHLNFNNPKVGLNKFINEFLKTDSLISNFKNYTKFFRFPYLKEGNNIKKRDGFRKFLNKYSYRNGHVTIDASDWYINNRMLKKLKDNPNFNLLKFKKYYIEHLYSRATYYDSLATLITGRKINHTLLLHHNLAAALFLDDLIVYFKEKGWQFEDIDITYGDSIYKQKPNIIPAGESLIWALAKQAGVYDDLLRYPAESSKYEEETMNRLGL